MKTAILLCASLALLVAAPALARSNLKAALLERGGWDALVRIPVKLNTDSENRERGFRRR